MRQWLQALLLVLIVLVVIGVGAFVVAHVMPVIHQECRDNTPMSWYYRSEGLCISVDLLE